MVSYSTLIDVIRHTEMFRYAPQPFSINNRRWEPLSATSSSIVGTFVGITRATTGIFLEPYKEYQKLQKGKDEVHVQQRYEVSICSEGLQDLREQHNTSETDLIQSTSHSEDGWSMAGAMATASGRSLAKFFTVYFEGMLVEMPLAAAEGLRKAPALWGGKVCEYGEVTDWRSGATVAGRTFSGGFEDGLNGLIMHPVAGAQDEGAWGCTKGLLKGTTGLASGILRAGLAVPAYVGQGLVKSIHLALHTQTRETIVRARRYEGSAMISAVSADQRHEIHRSYTALLHHRF